MDPFALIHYVQLQFAVHLKQLLHITIDSEATRNQAESERLLANARSVLEVESSSTFSRPELAKTNQIASFQC